MALRVGSFVVILALVVGAATAFAQAPAAPAAPPADPLKDLTAKVGDAKVAMDTMWVMLTGTQRLFFAGGADNSPAMGDAYEVASSALNWTGEDHFSPNTTGNGGGMKLLVAQIVGILAVGVFVVVTSGIAWGTLKAVMDIRLPTDEEQAGLDVGEHGISAYPEFHVAGGATARAGAPSAPRMGAPAVERAR